jgi:hypothetical protein
MHVFALRVAVLGLVALGSVACASTTGTEGAAQCPKSTSRVNADKGGALHGVACTSDAQCLYGWCKKGALQVGLNANVGVCTKDCSCGPGSQCSDDDKDKYAASTATYICLKSNGISPAISECAQLCASDSDCAGLGLTGAKCLMPSGKASGAKKVCSTSFPQ